MEALARGAELQEELVKAKAEKARLVMRPGPSLEAPPAAARRDIVRGGEREPSPRGERTARLLVICGAAGHTASGPRRHAGTEKAKRFREPRSWSGSHYA